MPRLTLPTAVSALAIAFAATAAHGETLRWAGQTDPSTMDPHAANLAPVLGFLNNVYEGLVRRGPDMAVEPSLAESWEPLGSDGWRFHLRKDVTFHNGESFTAEDVLFSYERASGENSDVRSWFAPVAEVKVVDDHTIDFLTNAPNPLFPSSIANWMILDKGWAEANGATSPARDTEGYTTYNANGTGPYRLAERQPDIRTRLEAFDGWWDTRDGNVTEVVFTPITSAATGVAALLSGEIDLINPVPLQDIPRLKSDPNVSVHEGVESRIIFFGFEHQDDLRYSDAEGNPFKDPRVRRAIYQAIDADAIVRVVMRGNAATSGLLIAPGVNGYQAEEDTRLPFDPEVTRTLLAEAGYPDGFSFGLRCPNDRYINDESICIAAAGMLERAGLKPELVTHPVSIYFDLLRQEQFDMYMLGWSPGTFDAEHPIRFLMSTPNPEKRLGSWNFGGYSNARVDELLPRIQVEIDPDARQAMVDEVHDILKDDAVYVPIHVQPLVWGSAANVEPVLRPDNFVIIRWITVS